jgi:3-oxoacyl-[acyl-carrier protein] reductase
VDLGLEGRVALVTAASRGLGRAVATELAREGARVVISSRDEETLASTAAEVGEETGGEMDLPCGPLRGGRDRGASVARSVALRRYGHPRQQYRRTSCWGLR